MRSAVAIIHAVADQHHRSIDGYEQRQFGITLSGADALRQMDELLRTNGTVFRIVDGRVVISTDDFTFEEAIVPALHVLGLPGFENALREFHEALAHHRMGEYADALTKSNHAFESTMKVIASQSGWDYSEGDTANKLVAIMLNEGLFPPMLESALNGLRTMLQSGVPTMRNKTPSAGHGAGTRIANVPESSATYAITVTAASIRLLITEWRRGRSSSQGQTEPARSSSVRK